MLTSAGLQAIYQDTCYLPNTFLFSATCHMTYGPFWGLNLGPFNHHLCFTQGPFSCSFCHLVQHTHKQLSKTFNLFLLIFFFFFPYFLLSAKQHRCKYCIFISKAHSTNMVHFGVPLHYTQ